jgi:hypothetical protein
MAIEYQGEIHYFDSIFGPAALRQRNDILKRQYALNAGITLVTVPFWWDKSPASLAATIRRSRPDLVQLDHLNGTPIPTKMPEQRNPQFHYEPNIPQEYANELDPTGWYVLYCTVFLTVTRLMMEKFDGVRVYWNGKALYSKSLNAVIDIPKAISFGTTPFEGELWMGYNSHLRCEEFIRNKDRNWQDVKIMVFDAPQSAKPYAERLKELQQST